MLLNASPRKTVIYLFIICLIVLSMPLFLRAKFVDSNFIGEESYSNYRLANMIKDNGFVKYDELSYSGRDLRYEYGYVGLLSLSPRLLSWILPIIFGLISFVLFYNIVKKYDSDIALISSLLLIFSPSFIYLFSVSTKYSGAVMFFLLGLYLYLKGRDYNKYLGYACFIAVSLFSIEAVFVLVLAGLFLAYGKKIEWKFYIISVLLSFGLLYMQFGNLLFNFGLFFERYISFNFFASIGVLFSDLGGKYGFGLFLFLLSLIGIYSIGKDRYRYIIWFALYFALLVLSVYFNFLILFVNFILVIFASYGVIYFIDMEWKSTVFRSVTILVIICGLLFSTLSFLNNVTEIEPSLNYINAVGFLNNTDKYVVFSEYTRGVYINLAGNKNVADSNFLGAPNVVERLKDSDLLLHANKMPEARKILDKYNIKHVLVDKEMKSRLYASDESELLFLLKYAISDFYKEYENDEVEIWGVYSRR